MIMGRPAHGQLSLTKTFNLIDRVGKRTLNHTRADHRSMEMLTFHVSSDDASRSSFLLV